jgi:dTDP-4-dehydrorhamnose 3,5-epimerase-like enzyme
MRVIKSKIQDFFLIRFKKNFDTRGEFYRNFSSDLKINKKFFNLKQINFSKN